MPFDAPPLVPSIALHTLPSPPSRPRPKGSSRTAQASAHPSQQAPAQSSQQAQAPEGMWVPAAGDSLTPAAARSRSPWPRETSGSAALAPPPSMPLPAPPPPPPPAVEAQAAEAAPTMETFALAPTDIFQQLAGAAELAARTALWARNAHHTATRNAEDFAQVVVASRHLQHDLDRIRGQIVPSSAAASANP